MFTGIRRIRERKDALEELDRLVERKANVLVTHYSCESFYDIGEGRTPRITSIAIRNFASGQTQSFSIHKMAELLRVPPAKINQQYDKLERAMLDEFDKFVRAHLGHTWSHWNMRDINYGFQAIEHRHRVLGGTPHTISEAEKFDIARALVAIFGARYATHPRLENSIKKNGITDKDFLTGAQEAAAFKAGEYVRLHRSTLRKVDIMASILERVADRTLKTDATWLDIYGLTPESIANFFREHWFPALAGLIASMAIAVYRFFHSN